MFTEARFRREQAGIRGWMMVVHMLEETTRIPELMAKRKETLRLKHAILTAQAKADSD